MQSIGVFIIMLQFLMCSFETPIDLFLPETLLVFNQIHCIFNVIKVCHTVGGKKFSTPNTAKSDRSYYINDNDIFSFCQSKNSGI